MERLILAHQSAWKKFLRACFYGTFLLLSVYAALFLVEVLLVSVGLLSQNSSVARIVSYCFGASIFFCVLVMASYPPVYIRQLWLRGDKRSAVLGALVFVLLNILTGYLWFYVREEKQRDINLRLI